MADLATLKVGVDSREVKTAATDLDALGSAAERAETDVMRVASASRTTSAAVSSMNTVIKQGEQAQVAAANAMRAVGQTGQLASHQITNLAFQFQDLGVQIASGQNPLVAFVQQGSQISGVMMQSGMSTKQFGLAILSMLGILKTSTDVQLAAAAATTGATAARFAGLEAQAAGAVMAAQAEIALSGALLQGATTAAAATAASDRLSAAEVRLSAAQVEAAAAARVLAVAQGQAAAAATAAGAATTVAFAPLAFILAGVAAAGVAIYAAFKMFQSSVEDTGEIKDYANSLGLTKKEMRELEDVHVTFGDVLSGVWTTISEGLGLDDVWKSISEFAVDAFMTILDGAMKATAGIYAYFAGGFDAIKIIWKNLPAVLGDLFVQAVNFSIKAVEMLVNGAVDSINFITTKANGVLTSMGLAAVFAQVETVKLGRVANENAGAAAKTTAAVFDAYSSRYNEALSGMRAIGAQIKQNIIDATKSRLEAQAAEIIAKRNEGKPKKADGSELKAAQEYLASLEKQIAAIGKTSIQLKEMEIADKAAAAAKVGLAQETLALGAVLIEGLKAQERKKANDEINATIKALEDELSILALTGAERDKAALALEREGYIAKYKTALGIDEATAAWGRYFAAKSKNITAEDELEKAKKDADEFKKALEEFNNIKIDVNLDALFGNMGKAMGGVVSVFDQILDRQEQYNGLVKRGFKDEADQAKAQQRNARLQINQYANLVGAAKGFFKQGTTGYKAMETAEKAFRLFELVMAAKSAAVKIGLITGTTAAVVTGAAAETAATVAAETAKTGATVTGTAIRTPLKVSEGAASMFASLGPLGFVAIAAMLGVMASLGFNSGGSSTPPKYNTGTGTVLGDTSAQSESLTKSIERLADIDRLTMRYSAQMASSLKSIEANIGGLTSLLVRTGDISASGAGIKTGTSGIGDINKTIGGLVSKIPVLGTVFGGLLSAVGSVVNALFGTKTSIVGQGLSAVAQTMADIVSLGFEAQNFTNVQRKSRFLGVTVRTRYSTETTDASDEVNRQFTLILEGFYDAITAASNPLGLALDEVQGRLNGFVVDIGQIDLKGLTGQEIQEKLTAVFGAAADNMARAAITGLDDFQKVGEGYFETVVRVASGVEQAQQFLHQLGIDAISYTEILNKQGDVTAEIIRQSILLNDASAGVAGGFAEIIGNAQGTGQELYDLVLTLRGLQEQISATGQNAVYMTTAMISAAGGLDAFQSGLQSFYDDILTDSERSAIELSRLTAEFQSLGVALPASKDAFKALIQSIDVTTAAGQSLYGSLIALTPAFVDFIGTTNAAGEQVDLTNQRREMEIQLMEAQGDAAGALAARRQLELAAMDASLRALQQSIYAAQDLKASLEAAARASAQTTNLQIKLMEEQGDAAGALAARRALELAALSETDRAIQEQIYIQQDANKRAAELAAAREAARQRAEAARAKAEQELQARLAAAAQLANDRRQLEIQLMELQGKTSEALAARRALELAGMDATLHGLQKQIYAAEDAAKRAEAASQLASEKRSLEIELMEALGKSTEALAARRALELAGMDATLRGLQLQIYAANDAREASLAAAEEQARLAEEALALARDRRSLEIELLEAQGFAIEALTLRRAMELEAIDESLRGIQEQIWAAQAQAEANELAAQAAQDAADAQVKAAEDAAKALQDYADALANVSQTVIEEINRLRGINATSSSASLKAQFATLTAQARTGNLDALGKLPELSRSIEEATLGTATSALEVARIRAWLAASLSDTLGMQAASDSMINATSSGLTFDGNNTASANAEQTSGELSNMSNVLYNALYQVAKNTGKSYELMDRWDGDGLPDIREDASDYY